MSEAEMIISFIINIFHSISCVLIILIIYKANKFRDYQEQLLVLQNLAELIYETLHIIRTAPCLFNTSLSETSEKFLTVSTMIFVSLSFQILALLAVVLAISITRAIDYRLLVTKKRVYNTLVVFLVTDTLVASLFFLPGSRSNEHVSHTDKVRKEERANDYDENNVIYVLYTAFQIIPPLVFESVSFYKVWKFGRWHIMTDLFSPRVALYMRRAKFILAVCIVIHVCHIPHKVFDCVLIFAHESGDVMHVLALSSTFLPAVYIVSKFPVFLICCKSYRLTLKSMICNVKHSSSIYPSSTV